MEHEITKAPRYIFQAYHVAETLKLKTLEPALAMSATTRTSTKLIYQDGEASFIFVYSFGALIFFNVEPARQTAFIEKLKAIIGTADPFPPPDDVAALEAAGVAVVRYEGAEHGFVHDPERPAHRADDAADAWRRVLEFVAG